MHLNERNHALEYCLDSRPLMDLICFSTIKTNVLFEVTSSSSLFDLRGRTEDQSRIALSTSDLEILESLDSLSGKVISLIV